MALWTCTCRKFQLDQLPCDHVLAVVRKTPYQAYDLCSLYYTREFWHETYRGVISPIPHISSWTIPQQISEFELQPPDVRTVAGRRRKRRLPSIGEELPTPNAVAASSEVTIGQHVKTQLRCTLPTKPNVRVPTFLHVNRLTHPTNSLCSSCNF